MTKDHTAINDAGRLFQSVWDYDDQKETFLRRRLPGDTKPPITVREAFWYKNGEIPERNTQEKDQVDSGEVFIFPLRLLALARRTERRKI